MEERRNPSNVLNRIMADFHSEGAEDWRHLVGEEEEGSIEADMLLPEVIGEDGSPSMPQVRQDVSKYISEARNAEAGMDDCIRLDPAFGKVKVDGVERTHGGELDHVPTRLSNCPSHGPLKWERIRPDTIKEILVVEIVRGVDWVVE